MTDQLFPACEGRAITAATASLAAPKPATDRYIGVLDGLRAVSISFVILAHVVLFEPSLAPPKFLAHDLGSVGVSVFFVISGYLITRLLVREQSRNGRIRLTLFYVRRALRLWPALYVYLGLIAALSFSGLLPAHPWHSIVASLIYVRNFVGQGWETTHIWSLSLEEQFYLVWPLFLVLVARRRGWITAALILLVVAWRSALVLNGRVGPPQLYIRTDLRIDTVLLGCLLALVEDSPRFRRLNRGWFASAWTATAAAVALVTWNVVADRIPFAGCLDYTIQPALIAVVVNWFLQNPGSSAGRLLQKPPFLYVGRLSYSLYLWQQLFLGPPDSPLGPLRRFPLSLALTILAALVSYHGVERPFLALKDRFHPPR